MAGGDGWNCYACAQFGVDGNRIACDSVDAEIFAKSVHPPPYRPAAGIGAECFERLRNPSFFNRLLSQLADEKVPDHGDFVSQANETAMSALTDIDGTQGNAETTWFFRGGMIVVYVRCCTCECRKPFWSLGLGEGEWKWICDEPRKFVYVPHRWNGLYSLADWNDGQGAMGRTQMDGFPKAVNNITMGDVAEAIRLAEEAANCKGEIQ